MVGEDAVWWHADVQWCVNQFAVVQMWCGRLVTLTLVCGGSMGKTVDIDENRNIMEEFEAIIGGFSSGNLRNPLEQIGLYIKDDYMEEDEEEAILQGEEGEILS
ncbi:Hypothetical predicted protein [Olea europaea subsp. europaea]|uniref:Uncharacterized protein n=1 Tax=Olea europaea subsp. europaea TaxID=158383 RepID=A0A8S0T534_OLEEU|nr:Hypothetical predicted protein [Olea europaea subsp. europaea]